MKRALFITLALLLPTSLFAATFDGERSLTVSEVSGGNTYLAGVDVTITAAVPSDLLAVAGTLNILAPVAEDAFLAGATLDIGSPVEGDLRAAGGRIIVKEAISGDAVIGAGALTLLGPVEGETRIAAAQVRMLGGSGGAVTVYGGDILLAGEFNGDVEVLASDRLTIGEGTVIRGTLSYNAPQALSVPESAVVEGGVVYTGTASYLPTLEEARTFAVAGAGVLLLVKILSVLVLVSVVVGLFPEASDRTVARILRPSADRFVLSFLLGFALMVATPVLMVLLVLSFVGIGLALLLAALYVVALVAAYAAAAVALGTALRRFIFKGRVVTWLNACAGAFVLQLLGMIPVLGSLLVFVAITTALGAIGVLAYRHAFTRNNNSLEETL